ncbi:uncharacterized protein LOC121366509, partial [Gigantopelta aegis]|uniref:uncharacterized protein LOC121366509 n=1 Tax=Gigantopelta aegis TaxID=1735272 RepID=UPI001B889DD0
CDKGLYGGNCVFNCTRRHCLNKAASCDHETGSCGGECEESWIGEDCTGCGGKYGRDCSYSCSERKCRDPSVPCDPVTGSCNGGCLDGWQGETCNTKCNWTYGKHCGFSCNERHCKDKTQCDHVTGSCNGPCVSGWQGDSCSAIANTDSGKDVLIIASIVVTVAVVIIVVVIVVVFVRWRRRRIWKDNSHETLVLGRPSRNSDKPHETGESNVYVNVGMTSTLKEQPIGHQPDHVHVVAVQQRVKAHNEKAKGNKKDKAKGGNTYCNVKISDQDDADITDAVAIIEADHKSDEGQTGNDVDEHDAYYNKTATLPEAGFNMSELETVIQRIRNQRGGFEAEFLKLPSGFKHPYAESQKPQHKGKNRFVGYYPYDNNRVVLSKLPNYPDSDYINASHVDAYNTKDYFIAAQAPREGTVVDFWRMIWEQDCGQIIMLTNFMEAGK